MEVSHFNSSVVIILTAGFFLATLLGTITQRAHLSAIPGYIIAGYLIGPFSPGFVADVKVSEQLAEIGVILMLFNVGLHIQMADLLKVKNVAGPGAIFQILISSSAGILLGYFMGWSLISGIIFGIAISVASTMILVKLLADYKLLKSFEGHISIGWLIVEDLITVLFLLLIPILALINQDQHVPVEETAYSILSSLLYLGLLLIIMATLGKAYIKWVIKFILTTKSTELLTLAVLALTFQVAIGASYFFGTSIALGAFMAGVVMGQLPASDRIAKNGEALKDVFAVIFFLAIGMLFDPVALYKHPFLFLTTLFIVVIIKPLAAFFIIYLMKYPIKTALLIAIAIAQIGEFSFIVAEEATRMRLLPDAGYDAIVAAALLSISLNPLLFKWYTNKITFSPHP